MKKLFNIIALILVPVIMTFAQTEITKSNEKVVIDGVKFILHTVEPGQTLYSICKAYEVSIDEVNEVNPGLDSQIAVNQIIRIPVLLEFSDDGEKMIYTVKSGDTLYSLCKKYGISENQFYDLNPNVKKGSSLKIGQEIFFPIQVDHVESNAPVKDTTNYYYHLVKKGDTLYGLARKFNINQQDILDANPELTENNLKVGEYIQIPKFHEPELTDQQRMIDSLANINFNQDETDLLTNNVCDSTNWYKHGNRVVISLLLPFEITSNMQRLYNQQNGNKEQSMYPITEKIIDFYSGFLVGLEQHVDSDIKIDLKVYDVGNDNAILSELLKKNEFKNSDLIIGPAFNSQADYFNQMYKDTSVSIVLPFINDSEILERYSNNILVKTSDIMMHENIAKYILQNPQNNYIIIQGNLTEHIKIASQLNEIILKYTDTVDITLNTVKFNGKSLVSYKGLLKEDKENVFIMPFTHEASTTKIFTDLFTVKDFEVTVLGSEQVLNFESIDPNYFAKVKYSYYSSHNIDNTDSITKDFIFKYQETFLSSPDQYGYLAYDVANFFVNEILKYGRRFSLCLSPLEVYHGVTGDLKFENRDSFAQKSFSNSVFYIYSLQEDFTFKQIHPKIIEEVHPESSLDSE